MTKRIEVTAGSIPDADFAVTTEGHLKYIGKGKSNVMTTNDDNEFYGGYSGWHDRVYQPGSTGTSAGTSVTYVSDKHNCSHKPDVGCKVGNFTLYPTADRFMSAPVADTFDVLVPLLDSAFSLTATVESYLGLLMWFPIKDFNAPNPGKLRVMAQRMNDFARGGARVSLWCLGSHGRTGTVLATCIGLEEPDVDPIDEVRKRHCKHAVENQAQLVSVFEALGRDLPEKWKQTKPKSTVGFNDRGWKDMLPALSNAVTNNWDGQCEYCNVKDKMRGIYSHAGNPKDIDAHLDCWDKHKIERAKALNQTIVDVSDSKQLSVLPKQDNEKIDDEQYKELIRQSRPFWKDWSKAEIAKFDQYYNKVDSFKDFKCPNCNRLIIDPNKISIQIETNGVTITHSDCKEFANDDDCNVLCKECLETDVSQAGTDICVACAYDFGMDD